MNKQNVANALATVVQSGERESLRDKDPAAIAKSIAAS
jgi:hypothetical protein